eukprot:TRINITY_DN2070_c0_g1_i9.p1 TRINITY_DN2070_c0_g1~~TRINITY_DN2070_c0_g1_i9.p1  ORF type:complete len:368 (-),score=60.01 TRINITY_DN2070_c0_g1_i9:143-1177(-)
MSDEDQVLSLLNSTERYEERSIPKLEKYVVGNVSRQHFSLEVNMALVKLYQFYPQKLNMGVLTTLLLQNLMHPRSQGFMLAMYMLPEKIQREETVVKLTTLSDHLECCQFTDFWTVLKEIKSLTDHVPGFEDAVRTFIGETFTRTYRQVPLSSFSPALGLANPKTFIESKGWKVQDETVFFSLEIVSPQKVSRDNIPFSRILLCRVGLGLVGVDVLWNYFLLLHSRLFWHPRFSQVINFFRASPTKCHVIDTTIGFIFVSLFCTTQIFTANECNIAGTRCLSRPGSDYANPNNPKSKIHCTTMRIGRNQRRRNKRNFMKQHENNNTTPTAEIHFKFNPKAKKGD